MYKPLKNHVILHMRALERTKISLRRIAVDRLYNFERLRAVTAPISQGENLRPRESAWQ